jgi:hypothetical protein
VAFVPILRVVIQVELELLPVEIVAARWVFQGGSTDLGLVRNALNTWWDRLTDPDEDAATLTAEMSAAELESSGAWLVTDFAAPFELRRLQWRFSRSPAGGIAEDQDVCTFHFIKATGGTPGTYVDGTDLPAVETAAGTFFNAIKNFFPTWFHSDQYRWYKDGPAYYELNGDGTAYIPIPAGNPAIRVTEVDVAGAVGTAACPPQTAMTVTERCSSRVHWGRFYLPAPGAVSSCDVDGRIAAATQTGILAAAVSFYNACRTASMVPVVFSIQKPARHKKNGALLPAAPAVAYEVTSLQMDNLFDVIRTRRYRAATVKTNTALT